MAVQRTTKSNKDPKPERKPFGALGTVVGKVKNVEFKVFATSKKEFCNVTLLVNGNQFRCMGMGEAILSTLENVIEGDEIAVFGFYESRLGGDANDKIYSEFRIMKVYDEIPDRPNLSVFGKFVQQVGTSFGFFLDVDTTADEAYPKFARLKVASGTDLPEFKEGDLVKATCTLTGKYCDMTIEAFKDPLAPEFASNSGSGVPVGDLSKLNRFRRGGASEVTVQGKSEGNSAPPQEAASKSQRSVSKRGDFTADIPF